MWILRSHAATSRLLIAIVLISFGCGSSERPCAAYAAPALVVRVTEGAARVPVCNAVVTVRDGDFSEILRAPGPAGDCDYAGPYERAGTYEVEVVAGARTKTVTGIKVTADACHVRTERVMVDLDP
jgi:hypothetical protein